MIVFLQLLEARSYVRPLHRQSPSSDAALSRQPIPLKHMKLSGTQFRSYTLSFRSTSLHSNYEGQGNALVNNRHSASDWFYNVKSIPQSGVLKEIRGPVLAVAAWSLVVSVVQRQLWHSNINVMKSIAAKVCIPGTAHSFLVSALGLLLVFRTNSSYQRFYVSNPCTNARD